MVKRQDGIEGRRSRRLPASIPITLKVGQNPPGHGVTAVVNRHGALVLSPIELRGGTIFEVLNELNSNAVRCRAAWVGEVGLSGRQKVAIEFIDDAPTFWGDSYEEPLGWELDL